ncbi:hypothetical protein [Pseudomonas syringae]|uniref:hypothetical protein n=1 Tax=Pseudomonas syringae TaxID=317 RepID=UPI0006E4F604|nr:hypothetical protein [Pseudomonas syringae]KPY55906.1 hypothetical protein ALO46_200108 [Pseudomonas syringae pv. solidagae]RMT41690.1 hypothetical protein ALP49_04233 [Pseudomonas syringae pv. solidagae]
MSKISLDSPIVSTVPGYYEPVVWPEALFHPLKQPVVRADAGLLHLLERRRSKRSFNALSKTELSELLWRCARTQAVADSEYGFELERRPALSAGAIHPIHILVDHHATGSWQRYDSRRHGLHDIPGSSELFAKMNQQCEATLAIGEGTRLLLVAEPGKTFAKYQQGESLIWRDAGVLLAIMAMVAEALGCAFCPLGVTGEPWASQLAPIGILSGVGVALIGGSDKPD